MRKKMTKRALTLITSSDDEDERKQMESSMSWEINSEGLTFMNQDVQVGTKGTTINKITTESIKPEELKLGEYLGRGSAAIVQSAIHIPTGQSLAVKQINIYDKEKRRQLMNDLKALEQSNCPFLVKSYGAFFDEGQVKLVLELMDHGSLDDILKLLEGRTAPLIPEPVLSKITQQILNGLMYLHKIKHQVHRDIKPGNILVSSSGACKLSDFGISKELGVTIGLCNTFVGTMIYMSPERINGKRYSYSSDIWSLGLVLFEIAIGKFPYPKPSTYIEMMETIMNSPELVLPDTFSPEFQDFISKCIKIDPDQRQSAIQLSAHPWILKYSDREVDICGWLYEQFG